MSVQEAEELVEETVVEEAEAAEEAPAGLVEIEDQAGEPAQ